MTSLRIDRPRGAAAAPSGEPPSTTGDPQRYVLVSCRYCLRPITLVREIDDVERTALQHHVRGCAPRALGEPGATGDDVLRHFRLGKNG
jgi:hypothetical protein